MTDTNAPPIPDGWENLEKQGIDILISKLHNNPEPAFSEVRCYQLGNVKTPQAIRPLIEALGDVDKSEREQAMLALVATGKAE